MTAPKAKTAVGDLSIEELKALVEKLQKQFAAEKVLKKKLQQEIESAPKKVFRREL